MSNKIAFRTFVSLWLMEVCFVVPTSAFASNHPIEKEFKYIKEKFKRFEFDRFMDYNDFFETGLIKFNKTVEEIFDKKMRHGLNEKIRAEIAAFIKLPLYRYSLSLNIKPLRILHCSGRNYHKSPMAKFEFETIAEVIETFMDKDPFYAKTSDKTYEIIIARTLLQDVEQLEYEIFCNFVGGNGK